MTKKELTYILTLAKKTKLNNELNTTTSELAKLFNLSQQSASRILINLENNELIKRRVTNNGIKIKLTEKSKKIVKKTYLNLKNIFEKQTKLKGKVKTGLGEGSFYMKQNNYKEQFKKLLDINPFEGTLNLKTKISEVESFLINKGKIKIKGFQTEERTFGSLKCYKVNINKIPAAIIIPERTNYSLETIEIISEHKLREKLNIKDNDEVIIQ